MFKKFKRRSQAKQIIKIQVNIAFLFANKNVSHLYAAMIYTSSEISQGFEGRALLNKFRETKINENWLSILWTEHNVLRLYVKMN